MLVEIQSNWQRQREKRCLLSLCHTKCFLFPRQASETGERHHRLLTVTLHADIREPLLHQKVSTTAEQWLSWIFTADLFRLPRSLEAVRLVGSAAHTSLFPFPLYFPKVRAGALVNISCFVFSLWLLCAECKWLALQRE